MTYEQQHLLFQQTEADWKAGNRVWRECDESFYYYCMEVLPPTVMRGGALLLGEPYTHDDSGHAVRQCCIKVGNKFHTMLMTRPEFDKGELFQLLRANPLSQPVVFGQ